MRRREREDHLDARSEKAEVRERMRRLRRSIPPAERARLTDLVEETLFTLPEIEGARTFLLFYSFGTEVATGGMVSRALRLGRRVLLPYLTETTMEAAEILPGEQLESTRYGPSEPGRRVAVYPGEVDIVVAPGLAFDTRGHRLGYGGGHYDRYLRRLEPDAVRIGVGFSLQIVERVPSEPEDEPVDLVVTDAGAIDCRPVQ